MRAVLGKLDERKLRWLLTAFFVALAAPAVALIAQAYSQLKWQSFRQGQVLAEEFSARVESELLAVVAAEESRSFGDYSFLVVEGNAAANFVQRSPLSTFPVESAVPGALGYFQVGADGALTTPLLPAGGVDAAAYGIGPEERAARAALEESIADILSRNELVQRVASSPLSELRLDEAQDAAESADRTQRAEADAAVSAESAASARDDRRVTLEAQERAPAAAPPTVVEQPQAAFDRLREDGERSVQSRAFSTPAGGTPAPAAESAKELTPELPAVRSASSGERQKRVEQGFEASAVPDLAAVAVTAEREQASADVRVRMFESELDPFEVGMLDTGELVMFRNAWRDGRRYIQGVLIDSDRFFAGAIGAPFAATSLAVLADLGVTYQGQTLGSIGAAPGRSYASTPAELAGRPLFRTRMSPPFSSLELAFVVNRLPRAPGTVLLAWVSVVLAAVLCGGFFFMYRFARSQMRLVRQQQDFVSAVSHELKTPLTSIRMYGEMLKAGWADDAKKQTYYDYIHSESERLSRLIENVLQLARLTRNTQHFDLKRVPVAELMDMVRSKVSTQVERAGFVLDVRNDVPEGIEMLVDGDSFAQIVINLVDNAIKFSSAAERKVVEIAARQENDGSLLFTVRDYGPGIPKGQMKRIFELFYRPQNELTRETVGTGIGLALVRQLTAAMRGRVDVRNCEPGAELRLSFPRAA
jgi:signal transduction histidine kinase